MRPAVLAVAVALLFASEAEAKRRGGGGFSSNRRGGGSSSSSNRHRTPIPPPRTPAPHTHSGDSSGTFLNNERGSSGSTHYHPNPSAPQPPPNKPGPIGFDGLGTGSSSQGGNHNRPIGFDKVNSEVQGKPSGSHTPSAPPYPAGSPPYGPPPSYPGTGTHYGGFNDHPPAYPGRPMNAPPTYQSNPPQPGFNVNSNPPQPGFHPNPGGSQPGYHGQYNPYPGQSYPGQQNFGNPSFGNGYPHNNQFGNSGGFGSYPGNPGYYPSYGGNTFGGSPSFGNSYGNHYGGSPFGGGYNGNLYYSPNNFGYSGYPGQYNQQKSRFGGLPIPIPIPIPIGGGGFGGLFGNSHPSLLDRFIKDYKNTSSSDNSTNVFILNNSTVVPCTTDHFVYDFVRVTVLSCTAETCSAFRVTTTTTNTSKPVVHSATITMCLEKNVTTTSHGQGVVAYVMPVKQENTTTLCRDVPVLANLTDTVPNKTAKAEGNVTNVTSAEASTTEAVTTTVEDAPTTIADLTTTEIPTTTVTPVAKNGTASNVTKVCEDLECYRSRLCLQAIEVVDKCNTVDCPFRRTGYKPCVTVKMCRSNVTALVSTFASINTTISKIDEYDRHNSVYDAANLTLIAYHRPIITFNCSQNATAPGCLSNSTTAGTTTATTVATTH